MPESRLSAAIDVIYDALKSAGLNVWDGPITTGDFRDAVYVGYDADPGEGGEERAGTSEQEWAGTGGTRKRNEELEIDCAAVARFDGGGDRWKPTRDRCEALLETVGQVLRSDPSLGQSPPFVAALNPGDLFQENNSNGWQARHVFTITIKTRV